MRKLTQQEFIANAREVHGDKWKDKLEPRVYEALCNYKVEITD